LKSKTFTSRFRAIDGEEVEGLTPSDKDLVSAMNID
jgi:hypothetical protein